MTLRILVNAVNDNARPRGPDRYLAELLTAMARLPLPPQIHLLAAPWQKHFDDLPLGPGGQLHRVSPPRGPIPRVFWQALKFPRIANRIGADVVFLPNLLYTPGLDAPSVLTAHDLLQFRAPDKFGTAKARALRWLIGRALARADRIISVSDFTAGDIARFTATPRAKVTVIGEGGPPPRLREQATPERFFLFVGKVETTKNVPLLIDAFAASDLLERLNYRLKIIGPDGNDAAAMAARLPHPRIDRPGFIPEAQLEQLYATARGFVFPSTAEGFGLVLLEAMARGCPVIAAEATSLPEVMGQAGLLVPPDDGAALTRAMESLADSKRLFNDLQSKGYARLAQFSWDEAAAQTHDLMRRTARSKPQNPADAAPTKARKPKTPAPKAPTPETPPLGTTSPSQDTRA